jgi:hypothetical protein
MANEMPNPDAYTGLTRTVLQYGKAFADLVEKAKSGPLVDADWGPIEQIVDVEHYERLGVFSTPQAEVLGWATYKTYVSQFAGNYTWEGTLRNVTEANGRVVLELEERNAMQGSRTVSNTVTIYEFNPEGRILHLEVYVMPLG